MHTCIPATGFKKLDISNNFEVPCTVPQPHSSSSFQRPEIQYMGMQDLLGQKVDFLRKGQFFLLWVYDSFVFFLALSHRYLSLNDMLLHSAWV